MANRTKHETRAAKKAPPAATRQRPRTPKPAGPAQSRVPPDTRVLTPNTIQRLHPLIGNRAVEHAVMANSMASAAAIAARGVLQREDGKDDESDDGEDKAAPKKPKKTMIDKAKSIDVLEDAYKDYVKDIKGGKVEVLSQAEFEKAYDKIYGKTKYAWDKYVKPGPGNLEGFAYDNVNYINKDIGSVDVVPHEMLHNNEHSSWVPFAGSELNEGTTEYLTIKAVKAAKYTPSHSYPDQEGVVQELVKMTSEDLLINAYFNGKTAALKKEMESKCDGTWDQFKKAMQGEDWAKAKAYLKPKKAEKDDSK